MPQIKGTQTRVIMAQISTNIIQTIVNILISATWKKNGAALKARACQSFSSVKEDIFREVQPV